MSDALIEIDQLRDRADAELRAVKNAGELEQFRIKYLGSKGQVKDLMNLLAKVPKEQKREVGQRVNAVKDQVTAAFEARKTEMSAGAATDDDDGGRHGAGKAAGDWQSAHSDDGDG
jgi:phenylalanyl-tRNA synthetase alpha subunit